jgi:hypothetical protein
MRAQCKDWQKLLRIGMRIWMRVARIYYLLTLLFFLKVCCWDGGTGCHAESWASANGGETKQLCNPEKKVSQRSESFHNGPALKSLHFVLLLRVCDKGGQTISYWGHATNHCKIDNTVSQYSGLHSKSKQYFFVCWEKQFPYSDQLWKNHATVCTVLQIIPAKLGLGLKITCADLSQLVWYITLTSRKSRNTKNKWNIYFFALLFFSLFFSLYVKRDLRY